MTALLPEGTEIDEVKAELAELREELRKLRAWKGAMTKYIPLLTVDGIEIGQESLRGTDGLLQFNTANSGNERVGLLWISPFFQGAFDEITGSAPVPRATIGAIVNSLGSNQRIESRLNSDVVTYIELRGVDGMVTPYVTLQAKTDLQAAGLTAYAKFDAVELEGNSAKLPDGTSDPTTNLGDASVQYRTDLDRFRGRANSTWESFAFLSDIPDEIADLDTTATGAELTELTDGSVTTLHSHASSGGGGMSLVVQEADQTSTSTTPADTELTFAVAANEVFQFEGVMNFNVVPSAADLKVVATGPTGAVGSIGGLYMDFTGAHDSGAVGLGVENVFQLGNAGVFRFWGGIHNGANAGNLTIQIAQVTASGTTTLLAGSYIKWQQET